MRFEGVFVATTTPFTNDGALDTDALKEHLLFLAEAGVHGLVPCGTTGEAGVLSRKEREEVFALTLEVAKTKGLKVIAGCGGNATAAVLELVKEAKTLGCDAALVVTPYYNKPTQRGLIAHFEHIANESDFPIVLYNVPGRTSVNLSPETALALFKHPKIVGIKEASGQYGQWLSLASTMEVNQKALLAGDDDAFAVILALGGSGIISASANVAPKAFVQLYQYAKDGKWEEAFLLQKKLLPLVKAMFAETSPAPAKAALELLGRGTSQLRLPLVPVTPPTLLQIKAALHGLELIEA